MRFLQNARQEVVAAPDLRMEFGRRVDRRVHVPSKPLLRLGQGAGDRRERRITDDEDVDVAIATQFPAGRGPEDESDDDTVGERCQRFAQHIDGAGGFQEERPQFGKYRRLAIRLKIDLPPLYRPSKDARARECVQLALHRAVRRARLSHDLPEIERALRVPKQPTQDAAARLTEQNRRGFSLFAGLMRYCTHFEYKCTLLEYDDQAISDGPGVTA